MHLLISINKCKMEHPLKSVKNSPECETMKILKHKTVNFNIQHNCEILRGSKLFPGMGMYVRKLHKVWQLFTIFQQSYKTVSCQNMLSEKVSTANKIQDIQQPWSVLLMRFSLSTQFPYSLLSKLKLFQETRGNLILAPYSGLSKEERILF